jgi:uncharacterized protein YjiS (DUF1127 family)
MEVAMCRNQTDQAEIKGYRLTPERWEFIRRDVLTRAREARAQSLREIGRWVGAQVAAAARRVIEAYRSWRRRQAAVFELGSLDDRSLRDLGINRSEIQSVVLGWDSTRIPRGQIVVKPLPLPGMTSPARISRSPSAAGRKNAA